MGGHADKGLFSGTRGSRRFDTGIERTSDACGKVSCDGQRPSPELRRHLEEFDGLGRGGISGCHRKDRFEEAVGKLGGKVEKVEALTSMEGIEQVVYRLPKRDRTGDLTGEMKERNFVKTVYDASKISTDAYMSRGMEAASNAGRETGSGKLGREWTGLDSRGVPWRGYAGADGRVLSFYPTK